MTRLAAQPQALVNLPAAEAQANGVGNDGKPIMIGSDNFVLGWQEWIGLPNLGLPSLKVKVDTGARTSALHGLHARLIAPHDVDGRAGVRFTVQPVPRRPRLELVCVAPIVDQRTVTSSNGEAELRFVIETSLEIGDRSWPIHITLTNRESMTYRMLIGRQALLPGMLVDPTRAFHHARRSHNVYRKLLRPE
jgi:ribosomal protein S6--L-glutamate ligase